MTEPDLDAIKERWIGEQFDIATFTANQDDMLAWAEACGETDPRFTDPDNPDFQAHPGFTTHLVSRRILPEDFPKISGRGIDGGKSVVVNGSIRAGDTLTATVTVADIYEKTGRSGTMVFIVQRMAFVNQDNEPVSTVDWRMIRNID
ncbi:MAG: MaoC family dehydratase [Actinomycetia bacterium]|nr:MaoC family dehydratase [Actinomycetes bacterium]MCP4223034.1 MaoC family dehydratase [Actinomycetes bacterium]MCP5035696.1 MaoC family dehydratase [Actinomycetes bacterium]